MEKLRCHKKTVFLCSLFLFCLSCFLFSSPVSALEFTGGNVLTLDSGTMITDGGTVNSVKSRSDLIFDSTNAFVYGLNFDFSSTFLTFPTPTNYLLTFDVTYISTFGSMPASGLPNVRYDGLESQTMNKLAESCTVDDTGSYYEGSVLVYRSQTIYHCSYLFFSHSDYSSFSSAVNSRIYAGFNEIRLIVSPGFVRTISFNGLSDDDRDWLEEHMPSGSSTADIEAAIESAREDEKQEYEDQADETEDTANDESAEAQSTATSLLSVVGQFIGVLTSAQPTNCYLNGNIIPHLPLGQLNLCQNDPPASIVVLGSLLLIAFVVPLAYHTVKRMLALIGSFQS